MVAHVQVREHPAVVTRHDLLLLVERSGHDNLLHHPETEQG